MSAQPAIQEISSRAKLGFVGLGWIGRKRLDAIASRVQVAALVDSDVTRLAAASKQFPDAIATAELGELLMSDIDGVVIATPNGCHAPQAIACLGSGLPVFCQKPLAVNAMETATVIAAAEAADCLLGIDYCYRHVAGMSELRRRIADGAFGQILALDLVFHNAYGPDQRWCFDRSLAGGGCLLDLGIHLLDLALWLQDAPELKLVSRNLFSQGRELQSGEQAVEDLAFAQFGQSDGAVVRLACSWHAHTGQDAVIQLALHGTRGGAVWRNVGGSFYDFELDAVRGTSRERLGSYPDAWGARALAAWTQRLLTDRGFDPTARMIACGAELIDAVYR